MKWISILALVIVAIGLPVRAADARSVSDAIAQVKSAMAEEVAAQDPTQTADGRSNEVRAGILMQIEAMSPDENSVQSLNMILGQARMALT